MVEMRIVCRMSVFQFSMFQWMVEMMIVYRMSVFQFSITQGLIQIWVVCPLMLKIQLIGVLQIKRKTFSF